MHLKRLEMIGFKSFAEKTRLEFEPGITSIVGPNGCGKSNIADAIRWSLGEMSAKSLRSQQMLDVIFNGTANRPAQGMSEVSLTFDNNSHKIPLDYTEVTITRRLFRSGESEYFINKTQCRLKDVRDLFLDTGIGSDGYYIMVQGKVEFVLAAKPEERRELFEEAAGVAKYKVRREETLRKLAKVEQDMLRLNDSLAIYKQQMDSLDAAVRKARQHQKIQEEVKNLEIAALLESMRQAAEQLGVVRVRQKAAAKTLDKLKRELEAQEASLSEERRRWETLEQQLLDLQGEVAQRQSQWVKAEAEIQGARERETELQTRQARLQEDITQAQKTLRQWQGAHSALAEEIQVLEKECRERTGTFETQNKKGQADQATCLQLQRDLEKTKARLMELVRLISHHRNESNRLSSLLIRNEEAAKAKQRELGKVAERRQGLEGRIQEEEQADAPTKEGLTMLTASLQALQENRRQQEERLGAWEQTIQTTRERLARLEAEEAALEHWLRTNPVEMASAALRQRSLPGIYGPVGDLIRTSGPFSKLLERALGDRAHYFVADTLNDAQAAIQFLSEERKGWATFLVLDRLVQEASMLPFEAPGSRSMAEAVECDEKFRPVVRVLLGKTFYVGATIFEEALMRGGAEPQEDASRKRAVDATELRRELAALRGSLTTAQAERDALKQAIAQGEVKKIALEEEHRKLQVVFQVQQESLNRLREEREILETEVRLLRSEHEECLAGIAQTQSALHQEETLLKQLEEEEKTLQGTVQSQESSINTQRQQIETHQAQVSQLRLDAETLRERLAGKQRENTNAERETGALRQRLQQDETERSDNERKLGELAALQVEKKKFLESLRASKEEQEALLSRLSEERRVVQEHLRPLEEELSKRREELADAQSRAQEAEFQVRSLEQEQLRLTQTLQESYQLSPEDAQAHYGELHPNPEELIRLKRRLESIGPVNLAAPEEHAQLEERYHFLLTQQQDLLKAKDDLHQAIQKINATTREHFLETFGLVRENFQSLFQTLFEGGEADLVLTDEHNLLETGVDIVAQPPGKKLQNIALLSGGEKALTAIALLFAFFMVKPSPFCLLDEVDAPLDEANVVRFLRMLKTFVEKTQFIIITHNKRTMEVADVLYGITMAELGVSSLMSVKMENVPKEVVAA
jgi:chromosome segregation protein